MKIRLMGSPDLVRAWSREMERVFGASCAEYPCRGSHDLRAYCDLDDRKAAFIAFHDEAVNRERQPRIGHGLNKRSASTRKGATA